MPKTGTQKTGKKKGGGGGGGGGGSRAVLSDESAGRPALKHGDHVCYICLEGGGGPAAASDGAELVHGGCGCRGTAGYAHIRCLIAAAKNKAKSWHSCPTCKQEYTGRAALGLARAWDEQESNLTTKLHLANSLQPMGELSESRRLLEEVVSESTQQFGGTHGATRQAKENLASLCAQMGEFQEAQLVFKEVLAAQMEAHGSMHIAVFGTKVNIANLHMEMFELQEARQLYEEVVTGYTEHFGALAVKTLMVQSNLANLLDEMGEHEEAQLLFETVLAGRTTLLGGEHVDTLKTKMGLATTLRKIVLRDGSGRWLEAQQMTEEAVAGFTSQLGENSEATFRAKQNLANMLDLGMDEQGRGNPMGDRPRAQRLYEEVVAGRTALHGPDHRDTLIAKGNLATLLVGKGQFGEARQLFEEAVAGFSAQLGPAHPHTHLAAKNLADLRRRESSPFRAAVAPVQPVVALRGLIGAARHNGKRGVVVGSAVHSGRFTVRLAGDDGTLLRVKPANLEVVTVPVGTAVEVGGLVGAAQHNSKWGTVVGGLDLQTGRYKVRLDTGHEQPLGLKPANLRLLIEGAGPTDAAEPAPESPPVAEPEMVAPSDSHGSNAPLQPGTLCKLKGLKGRADLNGSCALVVAPMDADEHTSIREKGRVKVQLCSSNKRSTKSICFTVRPESLVTTSDVEWTVTGITHSGYTGLSLLEIVRHQDVIGNEDNCVQFAERLFGELTDPAGSGNWSLDLTALDRSGISKQLLQTVQDGANRHCVYYFALDAIGHHLLLEAKNGLFRFFQAYIKRDHGVYCTRKRQGGYTGREWCSQPQRNATWQSEQSGWARANLGGGQTVGLTKVSGFIENLRRLQELVDEILETELLEQTPVWPANFSASGVFIKIANRSIPREDPDKAQALDLLLKVVDWATAQVALVPSREWTSLECGNFWQFGFGRPEDLEVLFELPSAKHDAIQGLLERVTGEREGTAYLKMLQYCAWRWMATDSDIAAAGVGGGRTKAMGWWLLMYDHSVFVK
jgi:tetratricopeptide (TPR) repeat protein